MRLFLILLCLSPLKSSAFAAAKRAAPIKLPESAVSLSPAIHPATRQIMLEQLTADAERIAQLEDWQIGLEPGPHERSPAVRVLGPEGRQDSFALHESRARLHAYRYRWWKPSTWSLRSQIAAPGRMDIRRQTRALVEYLEAVERSRRTHLRDLEGWGLLGP